jgi:Ca2+-binding RTX toxin-like protein
MAEVYTRSGGENLVNTTTAGYQYPTGAVRLSSGGFVVGIADGGTNFSFKLNARIYDASGQPVGGEIPVDGELIQLDQGFAVYKHLNNGQIRIQRYDESGVAAGSPFVVTPVPVGVGGAEDYNISILSSGRVLVTWEQDGNGTEGDVWGQLFDAAGTALAPAFRANGMTLGEQFDHEVTLLANGGFVVSWVDHSFTSEDSTGVRARIYDANGAPVGNDVRVNTTTVGAQEWLGIAGLAGGGFVVAWYDEVSTGILAQIFNDAGDAVGTEFRVETSTAAQQTSPVVTALSTGGFVVSWNDFSTEVGDADAPSIQAQVFDSTGNRIGDQFLVNSVTAGDQYGPGMVGLSGGGFAVYWVTQPNEQSFSELDIKVQTFAAPAGPAPIAHLDHQGTAADETVEGTVGHDRLNGAGGNDTLNGGAGDDQLDGGDETDTANGGAGTDTLVVSWGDAATAVVSSALTANAGGGFDGSIAATGRGTAFTSIERFWITTGAGNDDIRTGSGDDVVDLGAGDDFVDLGSGRDRAVGGDGIDGFSADYSASTETIDISLRGLPPISGPSIVGFEYVGTLRTGSADDFVYTSIEVARNERIFTGEGNDSIGVANGADEVDAGGSTGSGDLLSVNYAAATTAFVSGPLSGSLATGYSGSFSTSDGRSVVFTGVERFSLFGGSANDDLRGGGSFDRLDGGAGADTMAGGGGNDLYIVDNAGDVVVELAGEGTLDDIRTLLPSYSLVGHAHVERLSGGLATGHTLTGNEFNNILVGNTGNDVLDGGAGADSMSGGAGDDTYFVDHGSDSIAESEGNGNDTAFVGAAIWSMTNVARLETVIGTNGGGQTLTGNQYNNTIVGSVGNDVLSAGSGGTDVLRGGAGDDTYNVHAGSVLVEEEANAGTDTIRTGAATYSLAALVNIENLTGTSGGPQTLTGNALANVITGAGAGDTLNGGDGNDRLDGGAGIDTLRGGLGDDVFLVDNSNDQVVEAAGEGMDEVRAASTAYTLAANVENLVGTFAFGQALTGNAGANAITAAAGADTIVGGGGADLIRGGAGADRFVYTAATDSVEGAMDRLADFQSGSDKIDLTALGRVRLAFSQGIDGDSIYTLITVTVASGGTMQIRADGQVAESDILAITAIVGTSGNDVLTGTEDADVIRGEGGDDRLIGLGGQDTLVGGDGNDELDGGAGADRMSGGSGYDIYHVDDAGDVIEENAEFSIDEIRTSLASFSLAGHVHVENLTGTSGTGQILTGNDGANTIVGGSGDDVIDGGLGNDNLRGGAGNDVYIVNAGTDTIEDPFNGGFDEVRTSLSYYNLLGNLEKLTGTSATGQYLIGNDLNNIIQGGAGNDTITGGTGADTMDGGAGDDIYYVDHLIDTISGDVSGTDEIRTTLTTYSLENLSFIENLRAESYSATLIGNAGANRITGANGDDVIDGRGGADVMTGGAGSDVYYVDDAGDQVVEAAPNYEWEADEIRTTLASYSLAGLNNIEILTGLSAGGHVLTGNALRNRIIGGPGDDVIEGGGLGDTLSGGGGADRFVYRTASDAPTGFNEERIVHFETGIDKVDLSALGRVKLTLTYANFPPAPTTRIDVTVGGQTMQILVTGTLTRSDIIADTGITGTSGDDVLQGTADADEMYGEGGNDTLSGLAANDLIEGGAGNDLIDGGEGADTMRGGAGDDVFIVDQAGDVVVENAGEGTDEVRTALASYTLGANVERLTGTGSAQTLTGNALANRIEGTGGADTLYGEGGDDALFGGAGDDAFNAGAGNDVIDGGTGADVMGGLAGNDLFLVDDAGDRTIEAEGEGTDEVRTGLASYTLEANVENLTGTADTGQVLTGNGGNNLIVGGMGDDTIYGLGGDDVIVGFGGFDVMRGGAGDDVYAIDAGDTVIELDGEGVDEIRTVGAIFVLGVGLENLRATSDVGHDFRGNLAPNAIIGGDGNDIIRLQDGGGDVAFGKNGNDSFYFGGAFDEYDFVDGGDNRDSLILQGMYNMTLVYAPTGRSSIANIEGISLVSGTSTQYGQAGTSLYSYNLTLVDDNASAGALMKVNGFNLQAGENLTLNASAETDAPLQVFGGFGTETLTGGGQGDAFVFGHDGRFGAGDTVNGGGGYDIVYLRGDYTVDFNAAGFQNALTNVESIALLTSANTEFVSGGDGEFDYTITWADALLASGATFTVNGSRLQAHESFTFDGSQETNGVLRVFGGAAADTLTGGAGTDQITGGGGADVLTGGAGADLFRYAAATDSTADVTDVIHGFVAGTDRIDVNRVDAKASTADTNEAFAFIGSNAFSAAGPNAPGELRAFNVSGNLWQVEGDVNGDGTADLVIHVHVDAGQPLTAADFVV